MKNDDILKYTNEFIMCSSHPSKLAKKYCNECQQFICNACALEDHSDHLQKLSKLNVLYLNNKEVLNKFLSLTSSHIEISKNNSVSFKCMNFIFHEAKNFCKNCQKFICSKCAAVHFDGTHEIIQTKDYFSLIHDKVQFFLDLFNNFENWQKEFTHSNIICNFNKLREKFENIYLKKVFDKIYRVNDKLEDFLNKRKNIIVSLFSELNKFFITKNNTFAKNRKKFEEIEIYYKNIKFEKETTKIFEKFIEFEIFLDEIISEKEKLRVQMLMQNLNKLDDIVDIYGKELVFQLNGDLIKKIDDEVLKIENLLDDNQMRFENEILSAFKLEIAELEKMKMKIEKESKYYNDDEIKIADQFRHINLKVKEVEEIQTSIEISENSPLPVNESNLIDSKKENLQEQIIHWSNLEQITLEDLTFISPIPIDNKICTILEEVNNSHFKNLFIEESSTFSLVNFKLPIDENKATTLDEAIKIDSEKADEPVSINSFNELEEKNEANEIENNSLNKFNDSFSQKNETNEIENNSLNKFNDSFSQKNEEILSKPLEIDAVITEEIVDDLFSEKDDSHESSILEEQLPIPLDQANPKSDFEKRKTIDSEISKININMDESNTTPMNLDSKETELIKFDNSDEREETKLEVASISANPYISLSFSEKIELAKNKIQLIRENINSYSDYIEINQEGTEVDKIKIAESTINQLMESLFTWDERNQFELMSIGHNIKTIFVYSPLVDRIKEIEFTHKFPISHSYLNILPWTYISGGKDLETNQENNSFYKIRRDSEKTFELVNLSPMLSKRSSHIMIYHAKSNLIYAISGSRSFSSEKYDISNNQWTILPNLNSSREKATACIYSGTEEFLYVFSGFDRTTNKCTNTVERLNLTKSPSKWDFVQIKGIQNLLKRQAFSCFYNNNTLKDFSNQDNSLLFDTNQIYLLGGINLLKNETKDVLLFNLKNNSISNHAKLVMNENFAFNHSQFVNLPCYDPDLFFNFSDNFSVVVLDSKMKNFRSRKLDFI